MAEIVPDKAALLFFVDKRKKYCYHTFMLYSMVQMRTKRNTTR